MTMSFQKEFEERTGYRFQDKKLLVQALTHSSRANERHLGRQAAMNAWSFWEMPCWS